MTTISCRASAFGSLFDCALRWSSIYIDKVPTRTSARALLGTAFHAGAAAFDSARIAQSPISADDAADATMRAIADQAVEVAWSTDDLSRREVESKALTLHTMYCNEVSPRFVFTACEMALEPMEIDAGNGIILRLTGHMDRARVRRSTVIIENDTGVVTPQDDALGISDLKSGRRAIIKGMAVTGKHKPQLGIYELLYENTTGVRCSAPPEIIAGSTEGAPKFAVGQAPGARDLLVGTNEHPGLLALAASMFKSGAFYPNPQSFLCSERYCPNWARCAYHD